MLFPQKSFKIASRKIKACLTCNGELCLQDGKDCDPPPLHLARPGSAGEREAAGAGRGEEEVPLHGLCSSAAPAGSSPPMRAFGVHLPAAALKHAPSSASEVYVLGIHVWGFLLYFFFFSLCKMGFGGFFFSSFWWSRV